jgi:3-hydroxyanthranilate 3,4-dioxygenase
MERSQLADLLALAHDAGPYGDLPVPPASFDPQLYVSRNDRDQPFHLICERDTMLATLAGSGSIEFREAPVLRHDVAAGDFVYVPGCTPHRIRPHTPLTQVRFKALAAGLEALVWYCPSCSSEVWRHEFDTAAEIPQAVYAVATAEFSARPELRTCRDCGSIHPPLALDGYRWNEIAAELAGERVSL